MNIFITGGASGLGEAIVKQIAKTNNHTIYFTYSKSEINVKKIESDYINCKGFKCDFTKEEDIENLIKILLNLNVDVLINNAFVGPIAKNYFHKNDPAIYSSGFTNNVIPVVRLTQALLQIFRKKKSGKIITVLSSYVIGRPILGLSAYIAEKQYLLSLSKSWAIENAAFNITSNSISPDFMLTPLNSDTDERVIEDMASKNPLKKLLTVEETAEFVDMLVNSNSRLNGVNIPVNSGNFII